MLPHQIQRFWEYVNKTEGCWLWTGAVVTGYGRFSFKENDRRIQLSAHRIAWFLINGPIPDGLKVLHDCDKNYPIGDITYRRCVNPAHLFLGTDLENMADRDRKGRQARGQRITLAKLTEENVRLIRSLYPQGGHSYKSLGVRFGVDKITIRDILKRRSWAWAV